MTASHNDQATSTTSEASGLAENEFLDLLNELSPIQARNHRLSEAVTNRLTSFQRRLIDEGKGRDLILGQYVLEDRLGEGGMGVVYRATHLGMGRQVALKVLSPQLTGDTIAVGRFVREIHALSRLPHPNVVTAFDACYSNDRHFLVMEYVDGPDLDTVVHSLGPLSVLDALSITLQVAQALDFVHQRGVIHRDIKPSNLLLDSSGYVKVMDLGLAKLEFHLESSPGTEQRRMTQPGVLMGTVDFLSPEQARDTRSATVHSDIYSLGCTLFFLLTGHSLYESETVLDRLIAHRDAPIPSIRATRRDVPRALDRFLRKMLAKNAQDRPADMSEVSQQIQRIMRDHRMEVASLSELATAYARRVKYGPDTDAQDTDKQSDQSSPTVIFQNPQVETEIAVPHSRQTQYGSARKLRFTDWLLLAGVIVACLALAAQS